MTEFQTEALLELDVPESEIRDAEQQIQEGLGAVDVDVSAGGGQTSRSLANSGGSRGGTTGGAGSGRSVIELLTEQLEVQEDQLAELVELADGGGLASVAASGGGGDDGGGTMILGTGLASGAGSALAGAGIGGAAGTAAVGGMAAASGAHIFDQIFNEFPAAVEEDEQLEMMSPGQAAGKDIGQLQEQFDDLELPDLSDVVIEPTIQGIDEFQDLSVDVPIDELQTFEFDSPPWVETPPAFGVPSEEDIPQLDPPSAEEVRREIGSAIRDEIPEDIGVDVEESFDIDIPDLRKEVEDAVRSTFNRQNLEQIVKKIIHDEIAGR